MNHYHTLFAHENNDAVNEELRRLIVRHADLCTRGNRADWYYEWRHEHVHVHFSKKADWALFEDTFEIEHDEFLWAHGLIDPYNDMLLYQDADGASLV